MGTVLAHFNYFPGPDFAIPRRSLAYVAVNWNHTAVSSCGSVFDLVQTTSGYHLICELKPWFFPWSSKTIHMVDLWENFYLHAPGDPTPVIDVLWDVFWNYDSFTHLPTLAVIATPDPWTTYQYNPLPQPPGGYYSPDAPNSYPTCFSHTFP